MSRQLLVFLAAPLLFILSGCSGHSTSPMRMNLSVSPADGVVDVRLDAPIVLEFGMRVDRGVVERSFYLLSEGSMNDSLCSANSMMIEPMRDMMVDIGMMGHMLEAHSVPGQFQWVGDAECSFRPEAQMTPSTRYMIYLGPEMMEMMAGTSMMGRNSAERDWTLHFTTLDSRSHDSHH